MKKKKKKIIKWVATLLVAVMGLFFLQLLLVPKYDEGVVEGSFVAEYYKEEDKDFDVIFVGDCEVYENFSPVALWKEYGINSYIRGSAEQYIWQSYYLLEDTLRYETPKAVVFNVQSLQFDESQSEAYNRMTLEGMRWSSSKVNAILASMKDEESFIEYVFPILRYHSRWSELSASDFKYLFSRKKVTHNGYYMRVDVKAAEDVPTGRPLSDYSFGDNAWKYLDKMRDLCEENGIELILIKAPSLYPYWYDEYDEQVKEYADENQLQYINFLELTDEIGIDYSTDTYDAGLHMNLSGAEKLSGYLGEVLCEQYQIPDRRNEEKLSKIWDEKIAAYEQEKQEQYEYYRIDPEEQAKE
jgi:hypothetical protein